MRINPGFAKRVVIHTLEKLRKEYNDGKKLFQNDEVETLNYYNKARWLCDFYTYLKCNALIMGINIKSEKYISMHFEDVESVKLFENTITNLVEEYYVRVRKYLETLDDTLFFDSEFKYVMVQNR